MNQYSSIQHQTETPNRKKYAVCVGVEEASSFFGWPMYFFPVLVSAGHLKPLGKPVQNSRKWFAMSELERLASDVQWLDKAVRIVEQKVHCVNARKRRTVEVSSPAPAAA